MAVETDPCNSAITADRGILFSNGGSSAAWRAINFSLAADATKAARYYLFSLAKVLWSERYEEGMENGTGRRRNRLVDANVPYFFHPPTILRRI